MASVKELAESTKLTSLPTNYVFSTNPVSQDQITSEEPIPIIDFSLLKSGSPHQRSQTIHDLQKACQDWGFFMVINHGIPENLTQDMLNSCLNFFDLNLDEKLEYKGKHVLDPIRYGTSFNASVDKILFWRDYLKIFVHPEFHSPLKPNGFREVAYEYSRRLREIAMELLKGISESLGLEQDYIENVLEMKNSLQIVAANLYPPCPQPELAMGMPPHSDHGLLTFLTQNEVGGLQVMHNQKWVAVNALPNSFLVNTGDHIEILSNGKYKSVVHRAVVNNKATRISIAVVHGPSLEAVVTPAPELIDADSNPAVYSGMLYKDFLELQQGNQLVRKSLLDHLRINIDK